MNDNRGFIPQNGKYHAMGKTMIFQRTTTNSGKFWDKKLQVEQ